MALLINPIFSFSYIAFRLDADGMSYVAVREYEKITDDLWKFFFDQGYASPKLHLMFNEYADIKLPYPQNYVHLKFVLFSLFFYF